MCVFSLCIIGCVCDRRVLSLAFVYCEVESCIMTELSLGVCVFCLLCAVEVSFMAV